MYISQMSISQLIKEYKQAKKNIDEVSQLYTESDCEEKLALKLEEAEEHCISIAIAIANVLTHE